MRYSWKSLTMFVLHNFSEKPQAVIVDAETAGSARLVDLLWSNDSRAGENGRHAIQLAPYDCRWFRAAGTRPEAPPR